MDAGCYFEALEALEAFWLVAPPEQRELLQGLVQVAVACEHGRRGNRAGVRKVLARARARIGAASRDAGSDWALLLRAAGHYIEGRTNSLDFRFAPCRISGTRRQS